MHEKEVVQQVLVPLLNALQYLHEKVKPGSELGGSTLQAMNAGAS